MSPAPNIQWAWSNHVYTLTWMIMMDMDSSRLAWTVSDSRCLLPVTALEFCFFHQSRILISGKFVIRIDYLEDLPPPPHHLGEGPQVKIFSEDGQLMCIQEALPFRRVHGIRSSKLCDHSVIHVFISPLRGGLQTIVSYI